MQLRVRQQAVKGHIVRGKLYGPGETLPGDYQAVPAGLEGRLEAFGGDLPTATAMGPAPATAGSPPLDRPQDVPLAPTVAQTERALAAAQPAAAAAASAAPGATQRPEWYAVLRDDLGKEPSKSDLRDYAEKEGIYDLPPDPVLKDDLIMAIDKASSQPGPDDDAG